MAAATMLGTPAVRQIISKLSKSDKEEQVLIDKIASSCKKFGTVFNSWRVFFKITDY